MSGKQPAAYAAKSEVASTDQTGHAVGEQGATSGTTDTASKETPLRAPPARIPVAPSKNREDFLSNIDDEVQPLPSPDATRRVPSESLPGAWPSSRIISSCSPIVPSSQHDLNESSTSATTSSPHNFPDIESHATISGHLVVPEDTLPHGDSDIPQEQVIEGKIIDTSTNRRSLAHHRRAWIGIVFLSATVAGAVALMIGLEPGQSKTAVDDTAATSEPQEKFIDLSIPVVPYPPFLDDLPESVVDAIENDKGSPFQRANHWIWEDPNYTEYSAERLKIRFYLAMLFFATDGENWFRNDNWLTHTSECTWFTQSGFPSDSPYYEASACDSNGSFVNLSLNQNNLTGSLPMWYTSFIPSLRILDLGYNEGITGDLPVTTTTAEMEILVLSYLNLIGSPRFEAGPYYDNLKVLKVEGLQAGHNGGGMVRIIPKIEVYNNTDIKNYDGPLYPDLGLLEHLQYISYGHTSAHGTIPTEFGLATSLREIDLSSLPDLNGTIPSELGRLPNLSILDLSDTPHMTGTVPAELCRRVNEGLLDLRVECTGQLICCI